MYDQSGKL